MSYPGVAQEEISPEVQAAVNKAMNELPTETKIGLTGWGKKALGESFEITCPSGQKCRVKKIKFEDLLDLGVLDNLDLFRAMLLSQSGTPESSGASEIKMLEQFQDRGKRNRFLGTVNKVVQAGVVEPKVAMIDDGGLTEGTVFVGDIDFQDKMFLFGVLYQGRAAKLNQFREAEADAVGGVAEGESVPEVPVGSPPTPDVPGPAA